MKLRGLIGVMALLCASPAYAQTPTAAGGPPVGGPVVAGVCLLSQQAVFANAKVGVAAAARLKQLATDAQARIDAERAPVAADAKALDAQRAHLAAADLAQKQQALNARIETLQADAGAASRQVEKTREVVLARIGREAQPVVAEVYGAHHCGLLLDRSVVLGGNMAGDLTPDVVKGLDARISTITFDLEPAPPAQGPAAR